MVWGSNGRISRDSFFDDHNRSSNGRRVWDEVWVGMLLNREHCYIAEGQSRSQITQPNNFSLGRKQNSMRHNRVNFFRSNFTGNCKPMRKMTSMNWIEQQNGAWDASSNVNLILPRISVINRFTPPGRNLVSYGDWKSWCNSTFNQQSTYMTITR